MCVYIYFTCTQFWGHLICVYDKFCMDFCTRNCCWIVTTKFEICNFQHRCCEYTVKLTLAWCTGKCMLRFAKLKTTVLKKKIINFSIKLIPILRKSRIRAKFMYAHFHQHKNIIFATIWSSTTLNMKLHGMWHISHLFIVVCIIFFSVFFLSILFENLFFAFKKGKI